MSIATLLLCLCPVIQSLNYCVIPDTGDCDDCPLLLNNAPCNTLQYYANNSNFTSNSVFHFLEGEHTLRILLKVTNVTNLTLIGVGPHQNLNKVQCPAPCAGFMVKNFANFTVENLSFYKCGNTNSPTLSLYRGSGLSIDHVTINGFGIIVNPLQGYSSISNSRFLDSSVEISNYPDDCINTGPSNISINNCEMVQGSKLELRIGSSSLYWTTTDDCILGKSIHPLQNFSNLQNMESDPSAISSDPIRICHCLAGYHMPNCSSAFPPISAYSGEAFTLRLAVVGIMNGIVPGTIYAKFPPSSAPAELGDLQDTQHNKHANCIDVTYTVYSSSSSAHFYLTATGRYPPFLNISVDLKPCPIGFTLYNGACKCDNVLRRENIPCFINNQSILRPANTWIGFYAHLDNSSETGVVFSEHCPHGYCLPRDVYLSADDPDIQCADNRTGVLCGQCMKNYSLTLGGQKCSECSNMYLLLLFPLAASGLVLVAVLFVLNLTVAEGSINGLIFYANVISMSQYSGTSSQLYTFIAWLNLDLGIDTCFYDGMDAYAETWLQFAFPLYLWLIIAATIVACNIFPKLTEGGTQNTVKVLSTLLLLSYIKLQRILLTIFSFTTLRYPSGAVHYVWLYDANVHFLKGKHVYLFIAGVLVLGLLVLPYTLGLALFQCLQACSGRRVCGWVNKLKPVFDAYAVPYKDRYRMWTGLLLVTQTLLIILFSLNDIITGSPDFNHFVTLITSLALLWFSTRGIYRKWPCDILEAFFYAQLGVFGGGMLYASVSSGSVSAVADFSFATTLLVFLVVVSYHAYSSFRKVICCCKDEEALDPEDEEQLLFRDRVRLYSSVELSRPCMAANENN